MENPEIKIENNNFVRLSRSIQSAYVDGLLSLDEMWVLIWLWIIANPRTGRTMINYGGLSNDFGGRYTKNSITKIMLGLKRKKLLGFPSQQGRRGSFYVDIRNYPLSTGKFKELRGEQNIDSGRSVAVSNPLIPAEVPAEVTADWQKFKEAKRRLVEGFSVSSRVGFGRSSNNDNEKENYKERSQISQSFKRTSFEDFRPQDQKGYMCLEIAKYLGEDDMTFILFALKKYGFNIIEKVYIEIKEKSESIRDKGAYFNARIEQLAKEKDA